MIEIEVESSTNIFFGNALSSNAAINGQDKIVEINRGAKKIECASEVES